MRLLRLLLIGAAAALVVLALWAFAPVLIFMALVLAGLGALAAGMIRLAKRLRVIRRARRMRR